MLLYLRNRKTKIEKKKEVQECNCCKCKLSTSQVPVRKGMNIHLDNPNSADFRTLVHSFDLQQAPTTPTHKPGKNLYLILARNCTTDNLTVSPLHLSDHFFIRFDVRLTEQPSVPPSDGLVPAQPPQPLSHPLFLSGFFCSSTFIHFLLTRCRGAHRITLLHYDLLLGQL